MTWIKAALPVLALTAAIFAFSGGPPVRAATPQATPSRSDLFEARCSSCHGSEGTGSDLGPSLINSGAAAADFMLSTGRMPPGELGVQAERRPTQFNSDQIDELVAFVASLGEGPPIPQIDLTGADLTAGGALFRENCASCHQAGGAGAALSDGRYAPDLSMATTIQISEAMMIGPGAMPVFARFDSHEVANIAAYVREIEDSGDPGGLSLGRVGPVAEGLAAWAVGLAALVVVARWIGTREPASDAR